LTSLSVLVGSPVNTTMSESESESDSDQVGQLADDLEKASLKTKINPFSGGLSNSKFKKPKVEDNSRDITEIFKNKQNIETILGFLLGYKVGTSNPIKAILIRGNIGCGKMTLIKACLKKAGYANLTYDSDYETDDIFDNLLLSIEVKGFAKIFQQKGSGKKAVIIRDVDTALRSAQKSDFFKFVVGSKNTLPILMTSTDRSVGTEREVPKCVLQIQFENPSTAELIRHFSSDKISKSALEKVIENSNFDLRYVGSVMDGLEYLKTKVNIKKVASWSKDLELDTFTSVRFCADQDNSLDSRLVRASLYTNSTVFHNYPSVIGVGPHDMELCSRVAETCCFSEQMINYAFENQSWDTMEDIYNTTGTICPLGIIGQSGAGQSAKLDKLTYPSSNLTVHKDDKLDFALLEKESMALKILIQIYFEGNKFVGNIDDFKKTMKVFMYPVQAYKLANMTSDPKKVNTFLREFKKRLVD